MAFNDGLCQRYATTVVYGDVRRVSFKLQQLWDLLKHHFSAWFYIYSDPNTHKFTSVCSR